MGEWIEWKGGNCPVGPNTQVYVRFQLAPHERVPVETERPQRAKNFFWNHNFHKGKPTEGNITAYRIFDPHAPSSPSGP